MELDEIRAEVGRCRRCGLHLTRTKAVPGEGPEDARVMFVGEAPGKDEDAAGKPFVGRAGRLLNEVMEEAGLEREDIFITNVLKCRPPGNRNPRKAELRACMPYLERQIWAVDPGVVCTLGRVALQAFGIEGALRDVHGRVKRRERAYLPMYHPAAVLRNPGLREVLAEDMGELKNLLRKY